MLQCYIVTMLHEQMAYPALQFSKSNLRGAKITDLRLQNYGSFKGCVSRLDVEDINSSILC